ncbi:MAG TPA: amidophosphoribosyltransferase, partial [Actinomycetales bacterium]|nr:amidophosphoribosyltransferase [Actinomycetales bacterium]
EVEEICRSIDADSLGYLSIDGMIAASRQAESKLCTACFTGKYPIGLPRDRAGNQRLESVTGQSPLFENGAATAPSLSASPGGTDALERP